MKKKLAVLVLGTFLLAGLTGCGNNVPDGTVATVNGEPISQETLDVNYTQIMQKYQMYGADVSDETLKVESRNFVLDNLIAQELLAQEAEKRGLSVTDEELNEAINQSVADSFGGSQADFEQAVVQSGMTMEYYKDAWKEYMLQSKLLQDIVNNPETVDVIKAKHILVGSEKENAEQVAIDLIAQLDGGADFATLAKENSDDTGSAVDGGELGYFAVTGLTTSKMVDEFSKAAQELEVGEYSKETVKSEFGYHIILVEDKQSDVNLLENPENKYDSILQGIYANGLNNLAASLMEDAKIEILIDETSVPETISTGQDAAADNTDAEQTDAADAEQTDVADAPADDAAAE